MARSSVRVRVQIADLLCRDEADGIGDAEPYLWPIFFKIDGDNYVVANGLTGNPWIASTLGGHGNLDDTDVDAGHLTERFQTGLAHPNIPAVSNTVKNLEQVDAAATRNMAQTAKVIAENPILMRLKELETMKDIAEKIDEIKLVMGTDAASQSFCRWLR